MENCNKSKISLAQKKITYNREGGNISIATVQKIFADNPKKTTY